MSGYNLYIGLGKGKYSPPPRIKCPICGKSFEMRARNQKYCSRECKERSYKGGKG